MREKSESHNLIRDASLTYEEVSNKKHKENFQIGTSVLLTVHLTHARVTREGHLEVGLSISG